MNNLIVIKIGGNAMAELTPAFFQQIKQWRSVGKAILLVHGGGNKISAYCEKLQLPVVKKAGIRVTDEATLEVTKMVLLGLVQPQILQRLNHYHLGAIGLNAATNALILGEAIDRAQLGAVGKITQIKTALFERWLADHVGVIAPLAVDNQGEWLNINGDNAAAELATLLQAEALYLVTDVPGVLRERQIIPTMTGTQARQLQGEGIIGEGMQPKIKAAFFALEGGVPCVQICSNTLSGGTIFLKEE
ncbi:acetylglutamate kinase [Rodentibacter myodis]|uniref:Acetylglutamate kinase n=1 Tax=Rodentibacter myodis TaxID=1907939 RepID=A0A1V3JF40_9PAST|nr:acetylglutamate kinase [Rodentibacter myodis]OOF55421.1 acetylglutamate kinase [Rodentibacter myodis]